MIKIGFIYNLTKIFDALTFTSPAKPIFLEYPIIKQRKAFLGYRRAVWVRPKSRADTAGRVEPQTTYNQSENLMVEIVSYDHADMAGLLRKLWNECYTFNENLDYTYYTNLVPLEAEEDQIEGKWWAKFEVTAEKERIV